MRHRWLRNKVALHPSPSGNRNDSCCEISSYPIHNGQDNKTNASSCCWACRERRTFIRCRWECKLVQPLCKPACFLRKLESANLEIQLHCSWEKDSTSYYRDACSSVFMAALFITVRTWRHRRCPSAEEQIVKMSYIYTVEYCSAVKKNEIMKSVDKFMDGARKEHSEWGNPDPHKMSTVYFLLHLFGS